MVTLQQIAEKTGVSRGTVDRALHNRGRVDQKVADRIKRTAEEMGYKPNQAGRALARSAGKAVKIGVVIQSAATSFMGKVNEGIEAGKEEVERLGASVIVRKIPDVNPKKAIKEMYKLKKEGCSGIAVVGTEDAEFRNAIDGFAEEGIPVITFNSDIDRSNRLCFVGQNALLSGRTAGGLMAEILEKKGRVLVISGYPSNYSHKNRVKGFVEELSQCREDVELLGTQYAFDDNQAAEIITKGMIGEYSDLSGIYLAAAGVRGVCKAVEEMHASNHIKVISNDLIDENIELLKEGKIRFLLGQDAYRQGYEPIKILFDMLLNEQSVDQEYIYTEIKIKTKYNL